MVPKRLTNLFGRARKQLAIIQEVKGSAHVTQNINLLLRTDSSLQRVTRSVLDIAAQDLHSFEQVTEFLQSCDVNSLTPIEIDLVSNWLRKVVAANHIHHTRKHFSERGFSLYMMDTSFIDQPPGSWTGEPDFLRVVRADGEIARELAVAGKPGRVFRLFFVPDAEYIVTSHQYVIPAVAQQLREAISVCVARLDLTTEFDSVLAGDGFCITDRIVCEISKPSWQFSISRDPGDIASFMDRVQTVAQQEFAVHMSPGDDVELEEQLFYLV